MRELQLPELQLIQAVVRFSYFFGEAAQHLRQVCQGAMTHNCLQLGFYSMLADK